MISEPVLTLPIPTIRSLVFSLTKGGKSVQAAVFLVARSYGMTYEDVWSCL